MLIHRGCSLVCPDVRCLFLKTKNPSDFLEICHFAGLQLKLQFVCNKGDEFRIRGFSLGITDSIAEKSLQCVQISTIPGHFDGVADGTLYAGRCGLEGLCHLRIQHLGNGVDHVHISHGDDDGFPQILISFDVCRNADRTFWFWI